MTKRALFFFMLVLALFVSVGCAVSNEEAVRGAVATLEKSGTRLPTLTPVPPTSTPRPTVTPTATPTPTPFTGWVRYESATGRESGRLPRGVSPPNDVVGDPGMTFVHFTNGQEDGQSVETPWWWPVLLGGVPALLLLILGVAGAVLWIRRLERKEESRYQQQRQMLLGAGTGQKMLGSGNDIVFTVLATLQEISPRVYHQVEERLQALSQGGKSEN